MSNREVYKDALSFQKTSVNSPKFKRIQDYVSRVFGVDDPPPGFGYWAPRFYFLEQKKPHPLDPLKVWQGFNGSIYFEPIQLKNIKDPSLIPNKSRPSSCQSCRDCVIDSGIVANENTRNLAKITTNIFNLPAIGKKFSSDDSTTRRVDIEALFRSDNNSSMTRTTRASMKNFDRDCVNSTEDFTSPSRTKWTSNNIMNTNNEKKINPNQAVVVRNRSNLPIKGLAFKEAKQRMGSKARFMTNHASYDISSVGGLDVALQPQMSTRHPALVNETRSNKKKRVGKLCKGLSMKNVNKFGMPSSENLNYYTTTTWSSSHVVVVAAEENTPKNLIDKSIAAPAQSLASEQLQQPPQFSRLTTTPNTCVSTIKND